MPRKKQSGPAMGIMGKTAEMDEIISRAEALDREDAIEQLTVAAQSSLARAIFAGSRPEENAPRRMVTTMSVNASSLEYLDEMAATYRSNRGRVLDWLVGLARAAAVEAHTQPRATRPAARTKA